MAFGRLGNVGLFRCVDVPPVDRWHVDTPKDTDTAEAVEGHAPPENETTAGESDPTRN